MPTRPTTHKMPSATSRRTYGQRAQDLADRRSLVPPFDRRPPTAPGGRCRRSGRASRPRGRGRHPATRAPRVVHRDLGEQGAVGRIEAEDEEGRYEDPAGLGSGRAERHAPYVAGPDPGSIRGRVRSWSRVGSAVGVGPQSGSGPRPGRGPTGGGCAGGRASESVRVRVGHGFGFIHAGRPPSPVNSKRRRSGSKAAGAPTS